MAFMTRVLSAAFVASAATLGLLLLFSNPTLSTETVVKQDRFAGVEGSLCANQTWPNYDASCLNWIMARDASLRSVRFVAVETRDEARRLSTLTRVEAPVLAHAPSGIIQN